MARSQAETHTWIQARVAAGHTPTYTEMAAWSGRSDSTIARWMQAWVREGRDPRGRGGADGGGGGAPPSSDSADEQPTKKKKGGGGGGGDGGVFWGCVGVAGGGSAGDDGGPEEVGEGIKENQELSTERALSGLSPIQQRAVELLAEGKRPGAVAGVLGVRPETVSRWMALDRFAAALSRARTESHTAALQMNQRNGQKAGRLLERALERAVELLDKNLDEEAMVKALNAVGRLGRIAMEHGGYPKTERIEVGGELNLRQERFEGESDEDLEGSIAALETELQLLEGGRSDG